MKIVLYTYDKGRWLIPIFWHFYKKNWKDNPYKIDIITETEKIWFGDSVFYHGETSWVDGMIKYLRQLDDDKVLLIGDDFILTNKVNTKIIKNAKKVCKDNVGCLKLTYQNRYKEFLINTEIKGFKEYPLDKPYSMSFDAAVWQRDFLISILKSGESIWQTEIKGSKRIQELGKKVLWSDNTAMEYFLGGCMCKGNPKEKEMEWIKNNW